MRTLVGGLTSGRDDSEAADNGACSSMYSQKLKLGGKDEDNVIADVEGGLALEYIC